MKQTLWAAFLAALLLAAALAGCGGAQAPLGGGSAADGSQAAPGSAPKESPAPEELVQGLAWAIEPRYGFGRVEPIVDPDPMEEGTVCTEPGQAGYYLAEVSGGWAVLNTATGETALEGVFPHQPTRCLMGHLYGPDARYSEGERDACNAALAALGSTFTLETGHGGRMRYYLWEEEEQQVLRIQINEGDLWETPLEEIEDPFHGLLPVRRAVRYPEAEEDWTGQHDPIEPQEDGLYAVASPEGGLLTDFEYENACMAGPELIAVQKGGRWGYVNGAGRLVIPCEYEGFWGPVWHWDAPGGGNANCPAPCTEGCVVVKKGGETAVLWADGSTLLAPGQVEDAAPAWGGLLWVKTGGRWGALRLPER